LAVIVLAAGEGTRMRSASTAKVLHQLGGAPMLGHVLAAAARLNPQVEVVVVGHRREQVIDYLTRAHPRAIPTVQAQQLGTGHATRIGLEAAGRFDAGTVLVAPGDAPLLRPETLRALVDLHESSGAGATMLTSVVDDPSGYGRVLREDSGAVREVVEHRDATPEQLAVQEVSAGVFAFDAALLADALSRLTSANAQGEQYLPEVLSILRSEGKLVQALLADAAETAGVNDRVQLSDANRIANGRILDALMRSGVTVVDPASTWVDGSVVVEPDATLWPGTYLRGATVVGAGSSIGPEVTLQDTVVGVGAVIQRATCISAIVGDRATVGPYAYLRPKSELASDVHIGTFVEVKASDIGPGSKVPHLTYVGDASIGEDTNIGASSVFVNYDGVSKHRSRIGSHVRSGSDVMFVAPVAVGDGAYTAAGSVITQDVPPGAMAVARAQQRNIEGWVLRRRAGTPAADAASAALAARATDPEPDQSQPDAAAAPVTTDSTVTDSARNA
jgi:bifunctional UDP-N-acetylglucosamine pyrophosphorylase/glucosamine-1-phosphate N-acetyltransferase